MPRKGNRPRDRATSSNHAPLESGMMSNILQEERVADGGFDAAPRAPARSLRATSNHTITPTYNPVAFIPHLIDTIAICSGYLPECKPGSGHQEK